MAWKGFFQVGWRDPMDFSIGRQKHFQKGAKYSEFFPSRTGAQSGPPNTLHISFKHQVSDCG